ncbi:MAG TPA: NUDIX hydrolase N-terminal domain-containing protein [Anaerolineae bacterium]|nr:NUDIX hydrolase N-terminal domain-containing protein [Anaerolineae bacterium]
MTPAQKIALWADQLRDLAAMGLIFNQDNYNAPRYRTVQEIAMAMLALATAEDLAAMESLKAPIFSRPTPIISGDAAIIDAEGRILLIQRADNSLWAMPGGALEVGETPAEGVVREAFEETGVQSQALALIGVFDSRRCGTTSRHHLYHVTFLCQPLNGLGQEPSHANEILDVRWFAQAELPDTIDPGHISRIPEAFRIWSGDQRAFFD